MKKVLFASVAAIAFGAVSAQAAEPVKLGIGGYATQWVGYANQQHTDFGGTGTVAGQGRTAVDVQDDVNITFSGSSQLDNGITVSVEVDAAGTQGTNSTTSNASNKNIRKSFVTLAGKFGTIEAGEQSNVGALIHNSSPDVGGIGGQDGNWMNWVLAPSSHRDTYQRTYAGDDRSANKLIYITPAFYGVAAGVSYTPSVNLSQVGHSTIQTGDATALASNGQLQGDLWVYGLAYAAEFGDVSVKADVGSGTANVAGLVVYQGGLNVSYKGFTVGASVLDRDSHNSGVDRQLLSGTALLDTYAVRKGVSWDAGVSYTTGPYSASVTYFQGEAQQYKDTSSLGSSATGYDRDSVWTLAGAYEMGPGVTATASVFYVDYTSAQTNTNQLANKANVNNGVGAVTGLTVKF